MEFWKKYPSLRIALMLITFIAGFALLIFGWKMTGQMKGLCWMLVGLVLLLCTLYLYNTRFADPPERKAKRKNTH
ncbi:MAG: hypothetical protein HDT26_06570 [Subdoligranulum sp.]|nr:hypothetical protein [Subdoligranulum sp.]